MADYMDILKEWEHQVANPVIYENLDALLPAYNFIRKQPGSDKDHWSSNLKINLRKPIHPTEEKTVVYKFDFALREQGEWDEPVSVIDRLMEERQLSSVFEFYKQISSEYGLNMPSPTSCGYENSKNRKRIQKIRNLLKEYFTWNLYNSNNHSCRLTYSYLVEERGLTDEWINRLGLGHVPEWSKVENYILNPRFGFSKEELDAACPVMNAEGNTSVGSTHTVSIPYICGGEIKGFIFRTRERGARFKYRATNGLDRKSAFFNIQNNHEPKDLIVVEGEMDALVATSAGIKDVVAIGGSDVSGERKRQIYDALNRNTRRITLCLDLDKDSEGKPDYNKRFKAVKKSIHTIIDADSDFIEIYISSLPEPGDPDTFIRKNGVEAFNELIINAIPWWKYLHDYYSNKI